MAGKGLRPSYKHKEEFVRVVRGHGEFGCGIRGCRRKAIFEIFTIDGMLKSSRHTDSCCPKHLGKMVDHYLVDRPQICRFVPPKKRRTDDRRS